MASLRIEPSTGTENKSVKMGLKKNIEQPFSSHNTEDVVTFEGVFVVKDLKDRLTLSKQCIALIALAHVS